MKVLLLTVDGSNYHRDCWIKPLQEVYDTIFVSCRIMRKYYSAQQLAEYILNILDTDEFEYVFVYSDGMRTNLLPEDFYPEVRSRCKLVTFHADDEPEKWFSMNAAKDYRYQIVFTHSRKAAWRRCNGVYLQWGFNPHVHHKIDGMAKDIDVLFIGLNKCKEISIGLLEDYYEDGDLRQKILTKIYLFCKNRGYKFGLYGTGWQYHPVLKECDGGYISDEETVIAINRTKIVINIAFSMDNEESGFQTKLRHFEIGGCGSFQITNRNPDLEELYGDSIGFVDDVDEINDMIEYYLKHNDEREEKARLAYNISMRDHTMQHRLKEMFERAADYFREPLKLSYSKGIIVKSIAFDDNKELIRKIEDILNTEEDCGDNQYFHFYDSRFQLEDLNTSMLGLDSRCDIYLGRSIVAVHAPAERNTRITLRKSFPREALLLPAVVGEDQNSREMLQELKTVEVCGEKAFVLNMVVKRSALDILRKAIQKELSIEDVSVSKSDSILGDYLYYTDNRYYDIHTEAIRKILAKREEGYKVAFYGGRDSLAQMVAAEISASGNRDNVWIVDRDINGLKEMYGDIDYRLTNEMLNESIKPDIIALTSQRAEIEMWKTASVLEDKALLLPLTDMKHPNWEKV